jgi:predicted nucleic acid-binding protein
VILADSSILIEWQRKPSLRLHQLMRTHGAAVCGVTVAEVLTGARSPMEREKAMALISSFTRVPIDETVWELAGDISARLRLRGTPLMLADVTIAAAAIHHELPLWARDGHFERVRVVAPELVLFDEAAA